MKSFIDFVTDAAKKTEMMKEFLEHLEKADAKNLQKWFESKGYSLSEDESKKLIDGKESLNTATTVKYY
jgi:serine/threonine-protein kinase RIO1